jgi:hypothetical protein
MPHEVALRRVLYEIPEMQSVRVTEAEFPGANGEPLPMRVYGANGPIVVILEGFPDAGFEKHVGCRFMDMQWAISMAQLFAASGFRAVTHSNRDPLPDAIALLKHLGSPVGVWATSGHGPVALAAASNAACAVLTNPLTKDLCPNVPLFVVRSGQDETPGLNAALDGFAMRAIAENKPLTLVNYPDAPHSFELVVPGSETRRILQQGLEFMRAHLV